MCPSNFPWVYYNGKYCCATRFEKHNKEQGDKCDGSQIGFGSLCCRGDKHLRCPGGGHCQNYKGKFIVIFD